MIEIGLHAVMRPPVQVELAERAPVHVLKQECVLALHIGEETPAAEIDPELIRKLEEFRKTMLEQQGGEGEEQ